MSTRIPAQVKSTVVTVRERSPWRLCRRLPAARPALVRAGEERERRAGEDLQVEPRAAVLDVPEVELDPLVPRELRPAVHLRPAGQARLDLETASLPRGVLVDLVAEGRARADQAHVAADDVPELRELVEGEAAQGAADLRDPRVAAVYRPTGALGLGADDHRPKLQQVEVAPLVADPALAGDDGTAVLEPDRHRRRGEDRAREREPEAGADDVERPVHAVPSGRG